MINGHFSSGIFIVLPVGIKVSGLQIWTGLGKLGSLKLSLLFSDICKYLGIPAPLPPTLHFGGLMSSIIYINTSLKVEIIGDTK